MKLMIASDIHGSAKWCAHMIDLFNISGAERLLLLGDLLYHGPRNDLPEDYAPKAVIAQVEINLKYDGYIKRQLKQVEEFSRMEERKLPENLDYSAIKGLRLEAAEKLNKIKPLSFGQASRISGVSPADVTVLMIYMESRG